MNTAVLILEDHLLVSEVYKDIILAKIPDVDHVQVVDSIHDAKSFLENNRYQLFILDYRLKVGNSLEFIDHLVNVTPNCKIIVVSMHDELSLVENLFKRGIKAYVTKNGGTKEFIDAINVVLGGGTFVSSDIRNNLIQNSFLNKKQIDLKLKEIEIIRLVALGMNNVEIAQNIQLTLKTVENYKSKIKSKFGVTSTFELLNKAKELGII